MTSPRHLVPKVYDMVTSEPVTSRQAEHLLAGVVLNDSHAPVRALSCTLTAAKNMQLTLASGKYHQVKRMLAAVGNHVEGLHRSQIGRLRMPAELAPGKWCWLGTQELALVSAA